MRAYRRGADTLRGLPRPVSNTARAHRLGASRDWVVLYLERGRDEGQWTVVTAHRGPLAGRRIVRGREAECLTHYGLAPAGASGGGPAST